MKTPNLNKMQVANPDGSMHSELRNFLSQLLLGLNTSLSDEGINIPAQSALNIVTLNNIKSNRNIIYDSDNQVAKININGTYKTIQTS